MLVIENLSGGYGPADAIRGATLRVEEGEVVALLGANGAGKSTTLLAISGLLPRAAGRVEFMGQSLLPKRAHARCAMGLAHVPEGRRVFPTLTVKQNLEMGAFTTGARLEDFDEVFALFPKLRERSGQVAGTMSGGEQQMLAIGRALMSKPRLLILDEPSMGLAPKIVDEVFDALARLKAAGMTMLLIEQFPKKALALADRGYVIQRGQMVLSGAARELIGEAGLAKAYLS
jgi:branched-chain amino acid transport system ATP-binding protein